MKKLKKVFAAVTASLLTALPVFSQAMSINANASSKQLTWRFVEKYSGVGLEWYSSVALNNKGYTFGSSEKGSLIVNASNFQTSYDSSLGAMINNYSGSPRINGTGYLSKSTWYTPMSTNVFSLDYSYETSKGSITPIAVLVGDINQDGVVSMADADYLAKYIANIRANGNDYLTELQKLAADVNNDGVVNIRDASAISRFLNGSDAHF